MAWLHDGWCRGFRAGLSVLIGTSLVACAAHRTDAPGRGKRLLSDRQAERIIRDVAGHLRGETHIYQRTTFPSPSTADAKRLARISYKNIGALETLMRHGDDYVREVIAFGIELDMDERELRGTHGAFVDDVYAFINSLREARSQTSPPRRPSPDILYEYADP